MAARTGLTQQYVSLVEAGLQNITLDTMAALARAVGRDVSALLRKARNRYQAEIIYALVGPPMKSARASA